jgi:hypothetical protein
LADPELSLSIQDVPIRRGLRRIVGAASSLAGVDQPGKVREAAVEGTLGVFGKTAGRQFAHSQMVFDALAADAFAAARFVGAVTAFEVFLLTAFH